MFPGRDVESLVSLSREELLNLALTLPANSPAGSSPHRGSAPDSIVANSDAANSLEALEQAPDQDGDDLHDESRRGLDTNVQRVSDDVNGLSLSIDKQSSYVGASSITAALKVIFKVSPGARLFLAHGRPIETALPSRANTPPPEEVEADAFELPSPEEGRTILEAYFMRVHALMPVVDEQKFWHLYLQSTRRDAPWLALLNTVLALGSIASSNAESNQHTIFFTRAMHHLNIELLGSGNIMVVQALGLMSGYYLHYVNRPNLANNLMGATIRMATVLGMHRDFSQAPTSGQVADKAVDTTDANPTEIRRRTWWSLFCLDTWASTTNGRPTLGRIGAGVTVRPPRVAMEKMDSARYQEALKMLPLIHNTTFCKLSTRIQDTLAVNHAMDFEELLALDAELVAWHEDLPSILLPMYQKAGSASPDLKRRTSSTTSKKPNRSAMRTASICETPIDFSAPLERTRSSDGCPPFLRTARQVMHWRYQNLRLVLHRPFVLAAALKRVPFTALSPEEKVAVSRCRAVAAQSISDIDVMCEPELVAGWNAVWFMYQAVMVPLVSLFAHLSITATKTRHNQAMNLHIGGPVKGEGSPAPSNHSEATNHPSPGTESEMDKWRSQIETAIRFFERMEAWSVAAKKSKDVVSRLYEASERFSLHNKFQQQMMRSPLPSTLPGPNGIPSVPQTPQMQRDMLAQEYARQMAHAQGLQGMSGAHGFSDAPAGGFMTSFSVADVPSYPAVSGFDAGSGMLGVQSTAPASAAMGGHPTQWAAAAPFDQNLWAMQTPATEIPLEMFWQEMQWDTVPLFDGDEFNEYNMGVDMPGSVAMDFAGGEYFSGHAEQTNGGGGGGGAGGQGQGQGIGMWDYGR
ncbi:Fungal specific transcription factor domain-containing protein 8 [Elsinoe fawcettii]|nr:Fungal specific transcription factor domain-containing protein 8 [Elsinoe fawcettii]